MENSSELVEFVCAACGRQGLTVQSDLIAPESNLSGGQEKELLICPGCGTRLRFVQFDRNLEPVAQIA